MKRLKFFLLILMCGLCGISCIREEVSGNSPEANFE